MPTNNTYRESGPQSEIEKRAELVNSTVQALEISNETVAILADEVDKLKATRTPLTADELRERGKREIWKVKIIAEMQEGCEISRDVPVRGTNKTVKAYWVSSITPYGISMATTKEVLAELIGEGRVVANVVKKDDIHWNYLDDINYSLPFVAN